jgi:VIT1/CCC1 family predicted Fe2+/Mn2+ transporter
MIPYFAYKDINHALFTSIGITVTVLVVFGYGKSALTGSTRKDSLISAVHTLSVGVIAAGASYVIIRGIDSDKSVGGLQ